MPQMVVGAIDWTRGKRQKIVDGKTRVQADTEKYRLDWGGGGGGETETDRQTDRQREMGFFVINGTCSGVADCNEYIHKYI